MKLAAAIAEPADLSLVEDLALATTNGFGAVSTSGSG